ncbi:MAG TPA: family 16 glycoside hydrolase [Bacteroidota bacterium]|nr:family 16 glycoside hydrolase [Bacteroidota bacterium]
MDSILRLTTALCLALMISACGSTVPQGASAPGFTLAQLLERMPPRDSIEARWVNSSLIRMGGDSLLIICNMLGRPDPAAASAAQYALQGLATYVTGPGKEPDRMTYANAVGKALGVRRPPDESAFLIGRLQIAGKGESIGALAVFLTDMRLSDPSARALVAIRDGAEAPLLAALPQSQGGARITVIRSLGELRSPGATGVLIPETSSSDPAVRMAALFAIANIGETGSGDILAKAAREAPVNERNEILSFYLLYARRQMGAGNASGALRIAEEIYAGNMGGSADQNRAAALALIVDSRSDRAIDDLTGAMADSSIALRSSALGLAARIPGKAATLRWISQLERPGTRSAIISMLGERGDTNAYPSIVTALNDPDAGVRSCAVDAAVRIRKEESLPALLSFLERTRVAGDLAAVRGALERLPPERTTVTVASSLSRVTPPACVMLLEYLGRTTGAPVEPLFALAASAEPAVRVAALKALGTAAGRNDAGRLTALLLAAESDAEHAAAGRSLASLCGRIPDPEMRAETPLEAYGSATPAQRARLLSVICRLGGRRALSLASREARSRDPELSDAAVRGLAEWPTLDAFDTLLVVAGSKSTLTLRVLAIRGAVRLVERAPIPPAAAVHYHERTLAAAQRTEEKRLVLGALANLRDTEALRDVIPYISDDSLGLDAAMAAGRIASGPAAETEGPGSAEVARVFIESMVPDGIRSRVERNFDAGSVVTEPPEGFRSLLDGRTLGGWKGLVENPVARAKMTPEELARAQARADSVMRAHWFVRDGILLFDGKGENICTARDYTDFELLVDWKIEKNGDSGIYLRGSPQVQIWDPSQWPEGSGGLYNNQKNPSKPLLRVDRKVGEWNSFRIRMTGERVSVWLNGVMVVDSVVLENYWDRSIPIFPAGQIELQSHSSPLSFRNIFIRELPPQRPLSEGSLFNGADLSGWKIIGGKEGSWGVEGGVLYTTGAGGGWLSTVREYGNFEFDCDFRVWEGGNSGVFLRAPAEGDPAYTGMEIQVLDDFASEYAALQSWQYCGSIYGVQAPSQRATRKAREWQHYHIVALGPHISVTLNGQLIVDADLTAHMDKESTHPGLKRRSGFIGLQCHTVRVEYRNITVKEIAWNEENDRH